MILFNLFWKKVLIMLRISHIWKKINKWKHLKKLDVKAIKVIRKTEIKKQLKSMSVINNNFLSKIWQRCLVAL